MSYATQYADAALPAFQNRLEISLLAAAVAIANEAASTPNHDARVRLARVVLSDPAGQAARMAPGVVADGTTNNSSSDGTIDSRVSALWNAYAS